MNQNQTNSISLQLNRIFFLSQGKGAWGPNVFWVLKETKFWKRTQDPRAERVRPYS